MVFVSCHFSTYCFVNSFLSTTVCPSLSQSSNTCYSVTSAACSLCNLIISRSTSNSLFCLSVHVMSNTSKHVSFFLNFRIAFLTTEVTFSSPVLIIFTLTENVISSVMAAAILVLYA